MNITQDILIGIALAMDCFAVSIASGITTKQFHQRPMIAMIAAFGLFQGGMTLLGWYVSSLFSEWLQPIDHWIAFGLLSLIGIQMLREGFNNDEGKESKFNPLDYKVILTLAVATSIDALAVGVSLTFMGVNYWNEIAMPVAIITIISSLLTYVGLHIGIRIGRKIPFSPTPIGGIILIGIGIKIIIEHLS